MAERPVRRETLAQQRVQPLRLPFPGLQSPRPGLSMSRPSLVGRQSSLLALPYLPLLSIPRTSLVLDTILRLHLSPQSSCATTSRTPSKLVPLARIGRRGNFWSWVLLRHKALWLMLHSFELNHVPGSEK